MTTRMWRPADEAEATGNMAAFVEWLRATGRRPETSPEEVRHWWSCEPDALLAAFCDFAELAPDQPGLAALAEQALHADIRPADELP
jgi:hypothetical protein